MGQIITSLINFFLEVGRSGEQYKSHKNRSKTLYIFMWFFMAMMAYVSIEGFGSAFAAKAEITKLRKQNETLQQLKEENDTLKIRNEILSSVLSNYLGSDFVKQLKNQNDYELRKDYFFLKKNIP